MDDEIERLVIGVRADTAGFARDVDAMRGVVGEGLVGSATRAASAIEGALGKATRSGSLGFEDLRKVALSVLGDIAAAAIRSGTKDLVGSGGSVGGGLLGALLGLIGGSPGRATGGPVSPARPYVVGERGPELFVPTTSGSIVASGGAGGPRDVRVSITVQGGNDAPQALAASSRQVARAVKAALS